MEINSKESWLWTLSLGKKNYKRGGEFLNRLLEQKENLSPSQFIQIKNTYGFKYEQVALLCEWLNWSYNDDEVVDAIIEEEKERNMIWAVNKQDV